jgi:sulfur-oxidizing protein SoxX
MAERRRAARLFLSFLAAGILAAGVIEAVGAECKRKTAGFYLQYSNVGGETQKLTFSLKSMPAPLTGTPGDPERGLNVLTDRQKGDCLSCHKVSTLTSVADQGGIGPALDGVGSRYNDAQLRQLIVDPKAYFANTIMPSYYVPVGGAKASVLAADEVEDLIAYLKSLK